MPGVCRCDLTNACAFYHYPCTRGYRAHRAPGIPCALCSFGARFLSHARARSHRGARTRVLPSLRAQRSNPSSLCRAMDCFASLAMTVGLLKIESEPSGFRTFGAPLPLWERSDRIDRCDPGEGSRSIDRPEPLTPTLSHKGRGGSLPLSLTDASRLLLPPSRRGQLHGLSRAALFAPAQDCHRQHRMIESLQAEIIDRPGFDPLLDNAVDAPRHHNLVGLGFVAQPRRKVGDAADRGVFEPLLEADLAQGRIAQRDADAEAARMPAVPPFLRQP